MSEYPHEWRTKFTPGDTVVLCTPGIEGRVVAIVITDGLPVYRVEYWHDGGIRVVEVWEGEIALPTAWEERTNKE